MTHRILGTGTGMVRTRSGAGAWIHIGILVMGLLAASDAARAEPPPDAEADAGSDSDEEVAPDSPRASISQFVDLCRAGQYAEADRYLDLRTAKERAQGARLAKRLLAVLDRHVWIDFEALSPLSGGNAADGLPGGTDEIAQIPGPTSTPEPVRIVRRTRGGARWVFSHATVGRIDSWYARLGNRWALEYLPDPLLRPGPRGLLYWQWLAFPVLLLVASGLGYLLSRATRLALAHFASRIPTRWDGQALRRSAAPLMLGWTLVLAYFFVPLLALYEPAQKFVDGLLRGAFFVFFFWVLARAIDVARQRVADSSWGQHAATRSLLPLGSKVGKVLVLAVAVVALLSELGYPVASLVAGLGIGGLAIALAAQKTLENLFGAFSIGADQPFRVGDLVRVDEFLGTVETIGLRSTRFRTLDRTLITIPNGKLAEMRLESLAARDRMRLACIIGLVYSTTVKQMREVLGGLERVLREHPKIWPDAIVVRFCALGNSSLDIEVMAWFQTPDTAEFQLIRQDVLLQFMAVVEKAATSFAFPTRTLHLLPDKSQSMTIASMQADGESNTRPAGIQLPSASPMPGPSPSDAHPPLSPP